MPKRSPLVWNGCSFALLVVVTACGGSSGGSRETPSAGGPPILGAWEADRGYAGDRLACSFEAEFLADGTVEINHVDDDSPEDYCRFVRLPFRLVDGAPMQVYLGPHDDPIFGCLYAFEGDDLLLACEDHARGPRDLEQAIRCQRREVEELHSIEAFAGTWTPSAAMGAGEPFTIATDGSVGAPFGPGRFVIENEQHVTFHSERSPMRCLYRATERRVTLSCVPVTLPWPESFDDFARTLVLVRQR